MQRTLVHDSKSTMPLEMCTWVIGVGLALQRKRSARTSPLAIARLPSTDGEPSGHDAAINR